MDALVEVVLSVYPEDLVSVLLVDTLVEVVLFVYPEDLVSVPLVDALVEVVLAVYAEDLVAPVPRVVLEVILLYAPTLVLVVFFLVM